MDKLKQAKEQLEGKMKEQPEASSNNFQFDPKKISETAGDPDKICEITINKAAMSEVECNW